MSNKDLHLDSYPMYLGKDEGTEKHKDAWFYEVSNGIIVVVHGKLARISWRQIRAAVRRKDKK